MDIEALRDILKDESIHLGLATIQRLILAEDRSYLKVLLNVLPENRQLVADMTWEDVGPESGEFTFPSVGDLVLFGQAEGSEDYAFILKRLTSEEDKIPEIAASGDTVKKTKTGKKFWNISDTKVFLSRSESEPTENLVLGQQLKTLMIDLLSELSTHANTDAVHTHIGNLGYKTLVPDQAADFNANKSKYDTLKASPVEDETILSDLSYTEK